MDGLIIERIGKISLLLEPKIGNMAIENDSIAAIIASFHNQKKVKCVWLSIICIREGKQSHSITYVCLYS